MYLQEITRKALLQALKAMFCKDVNFPLVLGLLCKWMKSTFRKWCVGVEMQSEQQTDSVVSARRFFSTSHVTLFPLSSDSPNHLLREPSLSPKDSVNFPPGDSITTPSSTVIALATSSLKCFVAFLLGLKAMPQKQCHFFFSTLGPIPSAELLVSVQKKICNELQLAWDPWTEIHVPAPVSDLSDNSVYSLHQLPRSNPWGSK